jgi:predicted PurR-regulated permease PerM
VLRSSDSVSRARNKRLATLAGLWLSVVVALILFRGVVLPFAAAALIAYIVAPLLDRLTQIRFGKRRMPRWGAILVIYAFFFFGMYLALFALVPQLYRELARISREAVDYANSLTPERVQELARGADAWFDAHGIPISLARGSEEPGGVGLSLDVQQLIHNAVGHLSGTLQEKLGDIVTISRNIVTTAFAAVFMLFFMLMVAAFFTVDVVKIRNYVRSLVPPENADDIRFLVERIDRSLAGVVRGQLTICVINGTLTFIGLNVFGVKFAFVLATLATFFSLIPIFGTIISSVPIVAIALASGFKTGLGMLLWIIGIHALEAYLLNPKIMGTAARIHPIVVAFALIAGERTFGILGALFAVPITAVLVAVFDFARLKAQPPGPTLPASTTGEIPSRPPAA